MSKEELLGFTTNLKKILFMTFRDLNIIEPILKAIEEKGYIVPTSIQEKAIPAALAKRDILGCAQTGTGKTASFAIPIIQHLQVNKETDKRQGIKALILTPTRELALQISECIDDYSKYTRVRHGVIFGGVNQRPQVDMLRKGIDILVATPGRLLDLINQGHIHLTNIEYFVLDEADRMLDMGFIHDIKRILPKLPKEKQTLFFSATMPDSIIALTKSLLKNPVKIYITPKSSTVDSIKQIIYFVEKKEKSQPRVRRHHSRAALLRQRQHRPRGRFGEPRARQGNHRHRAATEGPRHGGKPHQACREDCQSGWRQGGKDRVRTPAPLQGCPGTRTKRPHRHPTERRRGTMCQADVPAHHQTRALRLQRG